MSEHPILFNGDMVRAILDGRKTQTRRIIKNPQRLEGLMLDGEACEWCPYGKPGDRLWVRETWATLKTQDNRRPIDCEGLTWYRSDSGMAHVRHANMKTYSDADAGKWRPSIHMPRWASRILLEVTDVRVERVQKITPEDAKAEGDKERSGFLEYHRRGAECHVDWFRGLWDSINGKPRKNGVDISWSANPFVWVVAFKVKNDKE